MSEYSPELGPYNTQVNQATNHTEKLVAGIATLALGIGSTRAVAQGAAADYQQMSSGMAAATKVTHQSYAQLSSDVRMLSRDLPVTTREALATVQAVQALGLTAKGQEGQVGKLADQMERLGKVTGQTGPEVAAGFGQLTREMASLDPARVQKFADVLVASSSRSGASAGAITGFAKAIAPMAQAAGVGEASVLGISTSFAKLGDDGYVAANAVSKMFGDLNRAVRDGSNDMAGYANAVGMTIDQFKALYQADPAKAVAKVTEAIGKMPAGQGQRTLEQLGITGVRAQRAFLEQAQSGGMMADINAARAAYGTGVAGKAEGVSLNTVQNSLARLGNAADQVAQTFERPLLSATNNIINAAGSATRVVSGVLSSGPVSTAAGFAAQAALPVLGIRMASRAVSTGALASVLGRSTYLSGTMAGIRSGRRGGIDQALEGSGPRSDVVRDILERAQAGNPLAEHEAAATRIGRGMELGSFLGGLIPQGGGGPGLFRQARGLGVAGLSFAARGQAEMLRIARMSPTERDQMRVRGYSGDSQRFADEALGIREKVAKNQMSAAEGAAQITKRFQELSVELGGFKGAIKELGPALGSVLGQGAATGAVGIRGVAKAGLGAAGSFLTSGAGIATIGLGAAYAGYSMYQDSQAKQKAFNEHADNLDPFGAVNAYRDQMGKAGESAMSLSKQLDAASQSVSAAASSFDEAAKVTGQDANIAGRTRSNVSQYFSGNASQMAAQVSMLALGKLQPSDVQGAKLDMLRQNISANQVNQALSGIGQGTDTLTSKQIELAVGGMEHAKGLGGSSGWWDWLHRHGPTLHIGRSGIGIHEEGGRDTVGARGGGAPHLGKQAQSELDLVTGALQQEQSNMANRYGDKYAVGRTLKDADKMMSEAIKSKNADLIVGMEQQLTANLTGGKAITGMTARDIQKAGGIGAILAQHNRSIGDVNVRDLVKTGAGPRSMIEDAVAGSLSDAGNPLSRFFSNFNLGAGPGEKARQALTASANAPDDLQKQHDAAIAIVEASQKAGESLGDLAAQAAKTTTTMADGDARRAVMLQVMEEAGRRMQNSLGGMSMGQQFSAQANYATNLAGVTGNSPEAQQARRQGQDLAAQQLNSERDYMKQRLMAQFQFEVASQRANEDYHKAVSRANEDFNRQQTRQAEDAAKAMYSPYQRIQAQPVWDVQNLMGNEQEQISAMRTQVRNISELKRLGMSQQAIDQLSLYDPTKAQQVAEMVAELRGNRGEVHQLNRIASQRQQVAGQLVAQDPQVRRAREDFRLAMGRQAQDFAVQNKRMAEDLHNADRELTGNMASLQKDMIKILHGQQVDWSHELKNNLANTIAAVKGSAGQLQAAMDSVQVPSTNLGTPSTLMIGGAGSTPVASRGVNVAMMAEGGIVTTDRLVRLAEKGSHEAVIPLNRQGVNFLADALREALGQIRGGGMAYASHMQHTTQVLDMGQHIHGAVTVKANSPAEWAAQARAQVRRANLTAPRSVRWGSEQVAL